MEAKIYSEENIHNSIKFGSRNHALPPILHKVKSIENLSSNCCATKVTENSKVEHLSLEDAKRSIDVLVRKNAQLNKQSWSFDKLCRNLVEKRDFEKDCERECKKDRDIKGIRLGPEVNTLLKSSTSLKDYGIQRHEDSEGLSLNLTFSSGKPDNCLDNSSISIDCKNSKKNNDEMGLTKSNSNETQRPKSNSNETQRPKSNSNETQRPKSKYGTQRTAHAI